jgi:hypothetical protein
MSQIQVEADRFGPLQIDDMPLGIQHPVLISVADRLVVFPISHLQSEQRHHWATVRSMATAIPNQIQLELLLVDRCHCGLL